MSKLFIALATMLFIFSSPQYTYAQTCKGKWSGKEASTITFKRGNKILYTYQRKENARTERFNEKYEGSPDTRLKFPVGKLGAEVRLRKSSNGGYIGKWTSPDKRRVARIKYACE